MVAQWSHEPGCQQCVPGAPPPVGSRLAESLERGRFARSFEPLELVGRGGFGSVLKARSRDDGQFYAVKLIPVKLRDCEVPADDRTVWCGASLFNQLSHLQSAHVCQYFSCWAEMHEDLPMPSVVGTSAGSPSSDCPTLPVDTDASTMWRDADPAYSDPDSSDSEGGFVWLASSRQSSGVAEEDRPVGGSSSGGSPGGHTRYNVVIVILMEFIDGVTLHNWLIEPELRQGLVSGSIQGALELFKQFVGGLADLHHAGIVHRDVKPENVMVTNQGGIIKIIDFGAAAAVQDEECSRSTHSRVPKEVDVRARTAVGTPGYAPPEHCSSRVCRSSGAAMVPLCGASPCADIFSSGIVLVELLMAAVRDGPAWCTAMERAAALRTLRSGYSNGLPLELERMGSTHGWLQQLALRMLVWDAGARPSTQEVLNELSAGFRSGDAHNPDVGMFQGL
eukprot:CAMPEP_0117465574 /NCGR_PEP_ID=MMETSP0784-20121206/4698_1 /TAXON_ID=39447 /ORGANISM="" /LENGTH=448 /DNA_ID=CAMNT_0005259491 /DNA_START=1 /DNA_END=1347 /DNA_ORIENTATION=+